MRRELSSLEQEQASKTPDVSAVRKELATLRLELSNVKEEGESLEHRLGEERSQRRLRLAREDERVKAAVAAAEEALARQEVQHANRREDARAMYAVRSTFAAFAPFLFRPLDSQPHPHSVLCPLPLPHLLDRSHTHPRQGCLAAQQEGRNGA